MDAIQNRPNPFGTHASLDLDDAVALARLKWGADAVRELGRPFHHLAEALTPRLDKSGEPVAGAPQVHGRVCSYLPHLAMVVDDDCMDHSIGLLAEDRREAARLLTLDVLEGEGREGGAVTAWPPPTRRPAFARSQSSCPLMRFKSSSASWSTCSTAS